MHSWTNISLQHILFTHSLLSCTTSQSATQSRCIYSAWPQNMNASVTTHGQLESIVRRYCRNNTSDRITRNNCSPVPLHASWTAALAVRHAEHMRWSGLLSLSGFSTSLCSRCRHGSHHTLSDFAGRLEPFAWNLESDTVPLPHMASCVWNYSQLRTCSAVCCAGSSVVLQV